MTAATVILAAGKQTRFRGDRLKCMSDVGGKPILAHLAEQVVHPAVIVTSEMWTDEDLGRAEGYNLFVERIKTGTIGQSVAAGLRWSEKHAGHLDSIYVISADTFCVGSLPIPKEHVEMLFDPHERITIWRLHGYLLNPEIYPKVEDRIEFAENERLTVRLMRHQWINVNTIAKLGEARVLWAKFTDCDYVY